MSPIPTARRELVIARDRNRCARCGRRGTELSHRRPRGVRNGHDPHCVCNLLRGCLGCAHDFAHGQPAKSRSEGWTLSRYVKAPYSVPVLYLHMWSMLDCEGGIRMATTEEVREFNGSTRQD